MIERVAKSKHRSGKIVATPIKRCSSTLVLWLEQLICLPFTMDWNYAGLGTVPVNRICDAGRK